jgi:hypothetical protein
MGLFIALPASFQPALTSRIDYCMCWLPIRRVSVCISTVNHTGRASPKRYENRYERLKYSLVF